MSIILVTYATRGSSTVGIADAIGEVLAEKGYQVEICAVQSVKTVARYSAVVAGSAIQREKWLPEAMQFLNTHQHELRQKPFAAFLACLALTLRNDSMRRRAEVTTKTWLEPVRAIVPPVSEGYFAGVLNLRKVPLAMRPIGWAGIIAGILAEGDHRDWNTIRAWADQLPSRLFVDQPVATILQP